MGHLFRAQGNIPKAVEYYRRAADDRVSKGPDKDSDSANRVEGAILAFVAEADAKRDSGHPGAAAELYRRAIETGDDRLDTHKQLANMLKDSHQFEAAFEQYTFCERAEYDVTDGFLQLGHLFKIQEKWIQR